MPTAAVAYSNHFGTSGPISFGERDMGFLRTTGQRVGTAGQLFSFFWSNKRWWLTPILVTLAIFAVLLILAQSSAIAPFIYSFF
jgi:Family of unknown function (DUF5989)